MAEKKAPTRSRTTKKEVDVVTENLTETEESHDISASGDIKREAKVIEPVDADIKSDHAQKLIFMEEMVTIHLHDPQDNNPEPIVTVGVNGRVKYLQRGVQHTLPRKYLEVLARARRTNYRTMDSTTPDGGRTTVLRATTVLQYPFTVIEDKNPKGEPWLRAIMNEKV